MDVDGPRTRCGNRQVRIASQFLMLLLLESASLFATVQELVLTSDFRVPNGTNEIRLIVKASHITIEGDGATLQGSGRTNDLKSLENAGVGVLLEGVTDVTLKNLRVRGFANGLVMRDTRAVSVKGCDFSDNYHNPAHGWGELPPRGGILCERCLLYTSPSPRDS